MSDNIKNTDPDNRSGSSTSSHTGSDEQKPIPPAYWKVYQRVLFRIAFVFFLLMSIPLSGNWYKNLVSIDWFHPHYRDIYDIARFSPSIRSFIGLSRTTSTEAAEFATSSEELANQRRRQSNKPDTGSRNKSLASAEDGEVSGRITHTENDSVKRRGTKDTVQASAIVAPQRGSNADQPRRRSFLGDYAEWGYALLIASLAGFIWTLVDRKRKEYNVLYYWIKVVVRYRAAIGIIGFGYTKLFPTQMPFPSLGLLNTDFGDFTAQKIYWLSVGIVPWYQVFGGVVELLAGGLLLFRRTTVYGAILLIGALGTITFVNYAYDGGVHVYAFYFVLLGSFLFVDDVPRLYNLLIREKYTVPNSYSPQFTNNWLGYTRYGLKGLTFLIFFGILTYTEVINFKYDPYKQPSTAGIKELRGNYNVTEFRLNDSIIPYSPNDTVRWQQATFEKWTTLTFKVNKPVFIDPSNGGGSPMRDIQRTFEITGTAGGQRAFHYYADSIDKVLYLQDKNAVAAMRKSREKENNSENTVTNEYPKDWISEQAWKNIGDENKMIDKRAYSTRRDREFARKPREINRDKMVLKYSTKDGSRVILSGLNENRDSIYVVLDRVERKYNLSESTLIAGKYE